MSLSAWSRALRPTQWIKNVVVAAACIFAWQDPAEAHHIHGWQTIAATLTAIVCFCLVSSGVYLVNDLRDIESDKAHPVKKRRPLASGAIRPLSAGVVAVVLLAGGTLLSLRLPVAFTQVVVGYWLLQMLYTFLLKRVAYVDVFIIASGFVMRAIAGAAALSVRISPWLLLCTFLLALFLALCKRRHEKVLLEASGELHREALTGYDRYVMDIQIAILAAATVVCYSIYTLTPETVERFGTTRLGLTIPLVIFGVFRYVELVYRHDEGGRPERVLLSDKAMLITVALYALSVVVIFATL